MNEKDIGKVVEENRGSFLMQNNRISEIEKEL